jgi:hypothetical protein
VIAARAALASLTLLAAAAAPARAAAAATEPVSALVRRCADAYGGKAALAKAARTRQEGTVTSLVLHAGETGRLARVYERPGRLRVEIAYPSGASEIRVLDGSRGWRDGEEVQGPRLAAMLLQAMRLDLPATLAAWKDKVEDRGTIAHGGKTLRVLAIEPAPGLVVEAALDPVTGRILQSRGASRDPGMPLEFVTTYSDFRKLDGVLVPMHEENFANGQTTGEMLLSKVEFPGKLPDGTFRP